MSRTRCMVIFCLGSLLFGLAVCSDGDKGVVRPTLDRALLRRPASAPLYDFAHAKPPILPVHHAQLLKHLEGVERNSVWGELNDEINAWEQKLTRDQRRDPNSYLPNRFPKDWEPARTWYAGGLHDRVQLVYVTFDDATYAIGAELPLRETKADKPSTRPVRHKLSSLRWSSTSEPARETWIERDLVLPQIAPTFAYDAARHGGELVVVCAVAEGLREYAFEARGGVLVERRRRPVGPPRSDAPVLLEVGPDLLLFWSEPRAWTGWWMLGGRALSVARLEAGSSEWSEPITLTNDLSFHFAVCARGEQVTVAWSDDRFQEFHGMGFRNGNKLCLATSLDRGATWSAPALLHDPADSHAYAFGPLLVLDDGARILALTPYDTPGLMEIEPTAETFVLSRDLARWAPEPARLFESLVELRRAEIASWPR